MKKFTVIIMQKESEVFRKQQICLVLSFHMIPSRTSQMKHYLALVVVALGVIFTIYSVSVEIRESNEIYQCPTGHFKISGMNMCHPWLNCNDLKDLSLKELLGVGGVKAVYRAVWKGLPLAFAYLNNPFYLEDFKTGLAMLKKLNPSPYVVQLVGFCEEENVILTEYHKNGNALNLLSLLKSNDVKSRLQLCCNFASILNYIHNSPIGTRVLCDSNDLNKLLSQFLVTDNFTLILNDVDALPEVNVKENITIKCGRQQLSGTFVAPEQLWPYSELFEDERMPGYNEKIDIWKAASVCKYFLGDSENAAVVHFALFLLHKQCKDPEPDKRPVAEDLLREYEVLLKEISKD